MVGEEAERLLDQVGRILLAGTEDGVREVLLYAMLDTNMVGMAVFEDRGNQIAYREDGDDLMYPLLDLWAEWDAGKRWEEMEYVIRDGKFDARFTFPQEIDREIDHFERRDAMVRRYFGDKPIVYPAFEDDDAWTLQP